MRGLGQAHAAWGGGEARGAAAEGALAGGREAAEALGILERSRCGVGKDDRSGAFWSGAGAGGGGGAGVEAARTRMRVTRRRVSSTRRATYAGATEHEKASAPTRRRRRRCVRVLAGIVLRLIGAVRIGVVLEHHEMRAAWAWAARRARSWGVRVVTVLWSSSFSRQQRGLWVGFWVLENRAYFIARRLLFCLAVVGRAASRARVERVRGAAAGADAGVSVSRGVVARRRRVGAAHDALKCGSTASATSRRMAPGGL